MNLTSSCVVILFLLISYPSTAAQGSLARRKHREALFDRFKGVRFTEATHYLPLNGTTADKKLVDLRGNATGLTENGVLPSTADQIGQVLTLDGEDSFIELKNIKDQCIVDPTLCREGLSVAFWMKYNKGKFIISSGQYTSENFGPGFRFICQSCSKTTGPHLNPSGRFVLELSTLNHKWKILLDSLPRWWFHFAFTWSPKRGLKFYKNGRLAVSSNITEKIESGTGISNDEVTIGKANSLLDMFLKTGYGDLSIGHLAIWTYELSKFDVVIAFLSTLTKTINSMKCCQNMEEDPCFKIPCHDGATCQRMEDKFQCICPYISINRDCEPRLPEPCEDKSRDCTALASQQEYCRYHWRRMKSICPKACKFCAWQHIDSDTTRMTFHATPVPNPSPGSQNLQTSLSTPQVPTTAVLGKSQDDKSKGISQSTLILIICASIGGLVLLVVLLVFILTRFYRQRKGEFVPDKTYANPHGKQNGEAGVEDVENISSFIDPSAPRITDVPHKPTRAQSAAAGGGGIGGKKAKKPMGVKVTYKPPKWD